jgi:NitT/TauT family transport system permease protein
MPQVAERPNIYCETLGPDQFGIIEKPLTLGEQIYNKVWLRKMAILVVLALGWEIYGRWLDNPLLVPPFSATVRALITDVGKWHHSAPCDELDRGALSGLPPARCWPDC